MPDVGGSAQDVSDSIRDASHIGYGQMLFARNVDGTPPKARSRFNNGSVVALSPQATQFMNVGQLNKWLARQPGRYESASQVLNEWRLAGSLKNEVAPNQNGYAKSNTRMVNLIVGHRVATLNIWARRLQEGQQLYFALHEDTTGDDSNKRQQLTQGVGTPTRPKIWRFDAWSSSSQTRPSLKTLKPDKAEAMGKAVFVGTVSKSVQNGPANEEAAMTFMQNGTPTTGVINNVEVFLGV